MIEYARQTCEALQYVHEQQIVHRDVKPANLICGEHGITLVDFGVATQLDATDAGTVGIGTPRFMAPEVFAGGVASPRSDVFSLAATVWNLITGEPPVYADDTKLAETVPGGVGRARGDAARGARDHPGAARGVDRGVRAARSARGMLEREGASLAQSLQEPPTRRANLIEAVVRTAAGVFEAAAASIALIDRTTQELVFQAAWGAGAKEIVGVRLPPGVGHRRRRRCRAARARRCPSAAATRASRRRSRPAPATCRTRWSSCRSSAAAADDRRAVGARPPRRRPLRPERRDSAPALFAELAIAALDIDPSVFLGLGQSGVRPSVSGISGVPEPRSGVRRPNAVVLDGRARGRQAVMEYDDIR